MIAYLFLGTNYVIGANYFSVNSGNWNTPGTWSNTDQGAPLISGFPVSGDVVTITRNCTVTVNIANAGCLSLQLGISKNGTGTLNFLGSSSQLVVSSSFILGDNSQGANAKTGSIDMTNGGVLKIGGSLTAPKLGTWTAGIGTIEYYGAAQTVYVNAYNNLVFSGSGTKSIISSGTSITGNLSIAPIGSAKLSINTGLNISVGSLTLGGYGKNSGTWGSTSSTATYTDNTYFVAATTLYLTVTNDTRPIFTITAQSRSKCFGVADLFIGTEFSSYGLINGDIANSVTLTTAGATSGANPGIYTIVPSAALGTGLTNYNINYTNGTYIVNPLTGTPNFSAGATTICQNEPDETYSATAANSTSISFSVLPVEAGTIDSGTGVMNWSPTFFGTATITATATGTCGTSSADRTVTIHPKPLVGPFE